MARKKFNRRRGRKKKAIVKYVPRTLGPLFPQNMIARHKWTQKFDLVIAGTTEDVVSTNSYDNIRCYNLYDPGFSTGTTGSAMFYDEMKAHYKNYCVLGAIMKVKFVNKCQGPIYAGAFRSTEGLNQGWTMTQLRERGFGGKRQRILGALNSGREVSDFRETYSLKKTLGVSGKQVIADTDNYVQQDTNNIESNSFPSQLFSFYCALVDKNLQTGDGKVEAYVTVDYTARWMDREPLDDQSS